MALLSGEEEKRSIQASSVVGNFMERERIHGKTGVSTREVSREARKLPRFLEVHYHMLAAVGREDGVSCVGFVVSLSMCDSVGTHTGWDHGKRSGKGQCKFVDGDIVSNYTGEWADDCMHGKGVKQNSDYSSGQPRRNGFRCTCRTAF